MTAERIVDLRDSGGGDRYAVRLRSVHHLWGSPNGFHEVVAMSTTATAAMLNSRVGFFL
jgi:hypothetical protein